MESTEKYLITDQTRNEETRSEVETEVLEAQSDRLRKNILQTKVLDRLFIHGREVVMYAANNERATVEAISDSISAYGYTPDEFTSGKLSLREIIHPDDDKAVVDDAVARMKEEASSFEREFRVMTQSGEAVWVTCVVMPEYNQDKSVSHFLIKIKDINKHKHDEDELRDAYKNLAVTLKSISEAVIRIDAGGYIEQLNNAAKRMIGIINPKARHKKLNELIEFSCSPDFSALVNPLESGAETRKMLRFDEIFMRCISCDKLLRVSCSVSPICVGQNKSRFIGYVLVVKDLSGIYDMWQKSGENESMMRGIFDHSADGIVLADQNGVIREWSRGYERITGVSREEVVGKTLWEAVLITLPPEQHKEKEREALHSELDAAVTSQERKMITRHVIHQQTGEHKILHVLYFPVIVPGKTMMGAISRDVTEEVRSRELIRQSEQKLRESNNLPESIMKTVPVPLYLKDKDGVYIECNDAFTERFGYTKEQITGKTIADLFPSLSEETTKADKKLLSGGTRMKIETRINTDNGVLECVVYRGVMTDNGEKKGIVGIILDISDLKKAERKLIIEKKRLEALGDHIPNGCLFRFETDEKAQKVSFSYLSKTWEKLTGITVDDALKDINIPFSKVHPDDLHHLLTEIREPADPRVNFESEIRFRHATAGVRWFQASAHRHRENGRLVSDGFILDITARKSAEMELVAYQEQLETLVKERTEDLENANEELYAANEEFATTNEELNLMNDQLEDEMVAREEIMRQLKDSESKIRNFIQQSFEGIMILDNQGRVIEWNQSLEKITKLPAEKAMGRYEWDLLKGYMPEEERSPEAFNKLHQSRLDYFKGGRTGQPVIEDLVLHMADGSKRYTQVSMFPIGLAEICYFGRILRDVTEQKLADMELEKYRTQLEEMVDIKTRETAVGREQLVSLGNNLPGGVIFQMLDNDLSNIRFSYMSASFADMFEIGVEEVMADITLFYASIFPEDQERLTEHYVDGENKGDIDVEFRIVTKSGKTKWIHMRSGCHAGENETRVWDGFMIDVTGRKLAERELENTRKQQGILIKVLQIIQSSDNIPEAINTSLHEIGKYADASRTYIFEKDSDEMTISNTYEWCNEGIFPVINDYGNIPIDPEHEWYVKMGKGEYISVSDVDSFGPDPGKTLKKQGVKSVLIIPLISGGINHGFIGFDDCKTHREWTQNEIDLLAGLSQIISTATRRHRAEMSGHLSRQTMRTVLDNIDANIYVADFESSKILFANKKIKEEAGEDIEGKICWEVLSESRSIPCGFTPNNRLSASKALPDGLYRWEQWNDEVKKWYECTNAAIKWVDGRTVHMEYATDITDRKKAEEAVLQSEEMYRQLTVASPDAVVVCNSEGHIRFVSSKAKELFGVGDDVDLNTLRIRKYVHPHGRRQASGMMAALMNDHVYFLPQLLMVREDGSEFFGEISAATVKDSVGNTTSVIMVIRDITRRKTDETELVRAKERAEESDKLKSAFLANMSHEIRTPVNGIIGFLSFLSSDTLSRERRREYIQVINNSSIQLVKLIDDIIDIAKIEAKQFNLRPVSLHLNELMKELHLFFETYLLSNNKNHTALILDDTEFIDPNLIFVDPMRLRQVLNNLLINAVKFTEKGYIRFGYRQSSPGLLEFVVEDSGIGLAPNQLGIIFERFRQVELTDSRKYGGTGLGLTISRSLVQLMGGDMHVESTEGKGSSFYFTISYLPVVSEDERYLDESFDNESSSDMPFTDKSVLIVEPEIMKYKYYEKLLHAMGVSAIRASDMQQWSDHIGQTNHLDAVIADISIFDDEKRTVVEQIKSLRTGLPTILIAPRPDDRHRILRPGRSITILERPVNYTELLKVLKKYIK